jgi:hypothetical protein
MTNFNRKRQSQKLTRSKFIQLMKRFTTHTEGKWICKCSECRGKRIVVLSDPLSRDYCWNWEKAKSNHLLSGHLLEVELAEKLESITGS